MTLGVVAQVVVAQDEPRRHAVRRLNRPRRVDVEVEIEVEVEVKCVVEVGVAS